MEITKVWKIYFSTTAQFRAEQESFMKRDRNRLETTLQASVDAFMEKEITSVEDTYTVTDEYNSNYFQTVLC